MSPDTEQKSVDRNRSKRKKMVQTIRESVGSPETEGLVDPEAAAALPKQHAADSGSNGSGALGKANENGFHDYVTPRAFGDNSSGVYVEDSYPATPEASTSFAPTEPNGYRCTDDVMDLQLATDVEQTTETTRPSVIVPPLQLDNISPAFSPAATSPMMFVADRDRDNDIEDLTKLIEAEAIERDEGKEFDKTSPDRTLDQWAEAETVLRTIKEASRPVPCVSRGWSHKYMKIMLVGISGLGKSTFQHNLLASYCEKSGVKVEPGVQANHPHFSRLAASLSNTVQVVDEDAKTVYHYTVQDTPGCLDKALVHAITQHITLQFDLYAKWDEDSDRDVPLSQVPDPRVDVVIYFLAPHRMTAIDLFAMKEISRLVPVIPVFAKSDCMTTSELEVYRSSVMGAVTAVENAAGHTIMHRFHQDLLEAAGFRFGGPPFVIIGSTTFDETIGRYAPVREYLWGMCEALQFSDIAAVKRLLFEVGYEQLRDMTEHRYMQFRKTKRSSRRVLFSFLSLAAGIFLFGYLPSNVQDQAHDEAVVQQLEEESQAVKVRLMEAEAKVTEQELKHSDHANLRELQLLRKELNEVKRAKKIVENKLARERRRAERLAGRRHAQEESKVFWDSAVGNE